MGKNQKVNVRQSPYNPLDKTKLGESVANALIGSPLLPLPPSTPFSGAGVYAIYYFGDFPTYESLRRANEHGKGELPIYVGKAVPKGARKGHLDLDSSVGDSLFQRLKDHSESLDQVGLKKTNFQCRYLVVDDIWIPLGESLLIRRFRPLWNVLLEGFGNHDPGSRRGKSNMSRWDTVHPGRPWVEKRELVPNPKNREEWLKESFSYLSTGQSDDLVMEDAVTYSNDDGSE
jgi:Eco29kI restriction endonuclease